MNVAALPARLRALWQDETRRVRLLAALGMAGIALLALSEWLPAGESTAAAPAADTSAADYAAELEARLCALIEAVDGAGKTRVMVTLAAGEETVYAADSETDADGGVRVSYVTSGGGLVRTVGTPQVLGVAVVCAGGGSAAVQSRVTAIVQALTDVGSSHVTVSPMTNTP